MQIRITARHREIPDALRTLIEKKLAKLRRYFGRIQDVEVVLEPIRHQTSVEIKIRADLFRLQAKELDADPRVSFERALSALERRIKRQKEKLVRNKKHLPRS